MSRYKKLLSAFAAALIFTQSFAFSSSAADIKPEEGYSVTENAYAKKKSSFDTKMSAKKIVSEMQVGYNVGNSLDATGGSGLSTETSWGNPKVTKKYIDALKAKGFKTVRFPVSWSPHVDAAYKVDSQWINRVKEVVDYAIDNKMYVIINMHHDNEIYDIKKALVSKKDYDEVEKRYLKVWTQIADTFKDYDEHLIFESMNEPRIIGSAAKWSGGTKDERDIVNKLNAAFVKHIRKSGGNNKYRFLMIPGYAASASDSSLKAIEIPDDKRIIVSVHAYSPYFFAFNGSGPKNFSESDKRELDNFFAKLNDYFVKKGTPVVIGEMGAINKENTLERAKWAEYYTSGAKKYNITCLWWDNGAFGVGEENFGIINRISCKYKYDEIADALIKGSKRSEKKK